MKKSVILDVTNDYYLLGIIFFLAIFKLPETEDGGILTYNVHPYILLLQKISTYIVIFLMSFSLIKKIIVKKIRFKDKGLGLFLFYLFLMTVALFSEGSNTILHLILITLTFSYFYFVISDLVFFREEGNCIINSILGGVGCFALFNLLLYLFNSDGVVWNGRLFGVTVHPNFLGCTVSIAFCISLIKLQLEKDKLYKALYISVLLISFWVCLLSGSRTAVGSCIFLLFVLGFLKMKNIELRFILIV
ncbi:MAG: hypothetical protein ACK5M3_06055, partial [Dysgonomonas sp.]